MSKAQTDIRTTSYDARTANQYGYVGTIDDAIAQIRSEPDVKPGMKARDELMVFLGVNRIPSAGPRLFMESNPRYGFETDKSKPEEPGFYTLAYAQKHFPESFYRRPDSNADIADRFHNLSDAQLRIFARARLYNGVRESLDIAEAYPYPAVRS
jgi:hypothetical protein